MQQVLPAEFQTGVTTVHQGDCLVSGDPATTFTTILGSCISACVRDSAAGVGGMNHFLLARQSGSARERYGASARYGAFAMEQLINMVLTRGSGVRDNLEIKVFGGGNMNSAMTDVGAGNIRFIREFLGAEGYAVAAEDVGGGFARRVLFKPGSGRVLVKRLDAEAAAAVVRAEAAAARLAPQHAAPDIELF